ncbi:hypothetical protein CU097_002091 [Rhizopus azygosporus]|uniref:C2H2-type domain-containing protein n=1 Tax=Rhizopus azygosporus TaxID=86630 RepID=A0A367IT33_RHIAZ|nr:hypothetical protein CU097_002091 [Rhizopus azygosporus]
MNSPTTSTSTGGIINNNTPDNSNNNSNHENNIPDYNIPDNSIPAPKTVVLAKKECPYCDNSYTTFQSARNHIYRTHGKEVERRTKSDQGNAVHVYNKTNIEKYNKARIKILVKFACISCTNVMNTKSELASHVDSIHIVNNPSVQQLPTDGHWIMQREDISLKFHHYRSLCIKNSRTTTFTIEDHFNELLSMSGILVLQKRYDYQSLPINIFPPTLLQAMRSNVISKYRRDTFNLQISSRLKTIIQQYIDEEMEETRAKIELLTLSEEATENERGVINAIVALLSYIYDCDMKPLSEAHLAASYIHPFVHGFLSSKMPAKVAHCSNIVVDENHDSNNRPDYKVDIYGQGYQYQYTNAYGEIKPHADMSPTLLVNDFYRLAIFCKDAIDRFNLNEVLAFQVVGNCITFFAMSLSFHHFYTFTELVRMSLPTKKPDLLNLIGHLDNLIFISSVHKIHCLPSNQNLSALKCATLSRSYLENVKGKMAPRKRQCSLTLDH